MIPAYDPDYLWWPFYNQTPLTAPMMPKIIHQLWLGGDPPMNLINTWKENNPSWKHILWTEENLKKWKFKNQNAIDSMPELNGKCDIMRYEILYRMGGFFIDADSICIKPLDDELFLFDCFSVYESESERGGLVACGFMAAQPNSQLLRKCIDDLSEINSPAWWYVGPAYFTYIIQKYKYPIKIHPSYYFIPKHYSGPMYTGLGPVYCDHLWGNTFEYGYERFKNLTPSDQQPNHNDKPKFLPHLKGLEKIRNCRRLSILCQYQCGLDRTSSHNQSEADQNCIREPSSATQLMKSHRFS